MAPAAKSCVYAIIDAATASAGDEACELAPDCACAVTEHRAGGQTYTAAHPQHDSGQLLAAPRRLHRQKLTDDYWAVFDPDGNGGVVVLNGLALDVLERFRTPRSLQRVAAEHGGDKHFTAAVERLTALGLLRHASLVTYAAPQRSKTLSAWLHLTNQCNLRCSYCYLYKTNAAISEANGYAAVDAVIRSALQHDYHKVKLKYAGGEPMLQFPLVLALHDYAGERCAKAGLAFQATLLTNGTRFSTAAVRELQRRAINIMVSLDGVDKTGNAAADNTRRKVVAAAGVERNRNRTCDRRKTSPIYHDHAHQLQVCAGRSAPRALTTAAHFRSICTAQIAKSATTRLCALNQERNKRQSLQPFTQHFSLWNSTHHAGVRSGRCWIAGICCRRTTILLAASAKITW